LQQKDQNHVAISHCSQACSQTAYIELLSKTSRPRKINYSFYQSGDTVHFAKVSVLELRRRGQIRTRLKKFQAKLHDMFREFA